MNGEIMLNFAGASLNPKSCFNLLLVRARVTTFAERTDFSKEHHRLQITGEEGRTSTIYTEADEGAKGVIWSTRHLISRKNRVAMTIQLVGTTA